MLSLMNERGEHKGFAQIVITIFQTYVAGTWLTIADLSVLASITQLEAMEYKLTGYRLGVVHE